MAQTTVSTIKSQFPRPSNSVYAQSRKPATNITKRYIEGFRRLASRADFLSGLPVTNSFKNLEADMLIISLGVLWHHINVVPKHNNIDTLQLEALDDNTTTRR